MADMQITIYNPEGKSAGKFSLPNEMFGIELKKKLLAQTLRVYHANQHRKRSKVKTRGEVKGSRRKIWRQKGTGRARHGDRYAPLFVGGGIAHGPTGIPRVKKMLPKKMRLKALFVALSKKIRENELLLVNGMEKMEAKTKLMHQLIENLKKRANKRSKKISIVIPENSESIKRATRNLKSIKLLPAKNLNAYQVFNAGLLVVTKDGLQTMMQTFLKKHVVTSEEKKVKENKISDKQKKLPIEKKAKKTKDINKAGKK